MTDLEAYGRSLAQQLPPMSDDEAEHIARAIAAMQLGQQEAA